ncbi:MAG: hypothetical protein AAB706_00635 [Patescibacteria group bacterium]
MATKLPDGWVRDASQEKDDSQRNGSGAYRWYEKSKGGFVASLVDGDIPNEGEWRISGKKFDSISSRGDIHIMLRKSDAENVRTIQALIRREKMR